MNLSHLYQKYFIDNEVYNCPFCSKRGTPYSVVSVNDCNWHKEKTCYMYIVQCDSCHSRSVHFSFVNIPIERITSNKFSFKLSDVGEDLDALFFYSIPDVSLALDKNIPLRLRQLISETESCLKQGLLTGASVYLRKLAYEIASLLEIYGNSYREYVQLLKAHMNEVDPAHFDAILTIINSSSDLVNERTWDSWNANQIRLMLSGFIAILNEYFVIPAIQKNHEKDINSFRKEVQQILFPAADK